MIPWLHRSTDPFPDTASALGPESDAPGLLAAGGELTAERLTQAYLNGVFPWFSPGQPVLWWAPEPRMVLLPAEFKLARSLRKTLKRFVATPGCELRIDCAFPSVIAHCAHTLRDGAAGTWIVPEMIDAYRRWHEAGVVHSFETWMGGELVGGLYGVGLGRMFFGESMFSLRTDASKIALAGLVAFCLTKGIDTIDCQQRTSHLASLGAAEMPRATFEARLRAAAARPPIADWSYDLSMWRQLGSSSAFSPDIGP